MFDPNFETAFKLVIQKEGGYVNDPHDKGGETKYGISKKVYPNLDIKNLTLQQAKQIYSKDYWLKSKANQMPARLALIHFDTAVNAGVRIAGKLLQRALNRQGFNLTVDGIVGPKTLDAIKKADLDRLLADYTIERSKYYLRTKNKRYLRGWLNRSISVYEFASRYTAVVLAGLAFGLLFGYILKKGV